MDKIYIFSGLGIDYRVFEGIDFGKFDINFIGWIAPEKNESLPAYANRIAEKFTVPDPIVIGLSFGGIVGVEISKIIKLKKLILISSAKNKLELPLIFRWAGRMGANKWLPNSILKHQNFITNYLFGIESKSDEKLFREILKDVDNTFLNWAVNEIVNWKNLVSPENCVHIHGNRDRVLPIKNIKADIVIKNAGHFMTVNRSKEISKVLKTIFSQF